MIHFKSCEWKNFLSTGNDPIKIELDTLDKNKILKSLRYNT